MSHMTDTLWKVSFIVPFKHADTFTDLLDNASGPVPSAVAMCEVNVSPANVTGSIIAYGELELAGDWRVEAFYETEPDTNIIRQLIKPMEETLDLTVRDFIKEQLPETDWVTRSLEGLAPVRAGRFFVYGGHDADKIPAGSISIRIDAAQAFGSGHHATTQGCLEYLSEITGNSPPHHALDLGTGSGVLAIALARLTHRLVMASDIDPLSTRIARENARINGVAPLVRTFTAKGFGHPDLARQSPYDLIIANILARPLVSLAPAFHRHLMPGGTLILSGILRGQEKMVTSACRDQGLYLISRKPIGDWVTLRLQR